MEPVNPFQSPECSDPPELTRPSERTEREWLVSDRRWLGRLLTAQWGGVGAMGAGVLVLNDSLGWLGWIWRGVRGLTRGWAPPYMPDWMQASLMGIGGTIWFSIFVGIIFAVVFHGYFAWKISRRFMNPWIAWGLSVAGAFFYPAGAVIWGPTVWLLATWRLSSTESTSGRLRPE